MFFTFLFFGGDAAAFNDSIVSLIEAESFDNTRLYLIFDKNKEEYKIAPIYNRNIRFVFNASQEKAIPELENELQDSDVLFFMEEGDTVDPCCFEYIGYFFEEHKEECSVLQISSSKNSINNGLVCVGGNTILPGSIKGTAILAKVFKESGLKLRLDKDTFWELILKTVLQQKAYGVLNTVSYTYGSVTAFPSVDVLKSVVSHELESDGFIPNVLARFILDNINKYVASQDTNLLRVRELLQCVPSKLLKEHIKENPYIYIRLFDCSKDGGIGILMEEERNEESTARLAKNAVEQLGFFIGNEEILPFAEIKVSIADIENYFDKTVIRGTYALPVSFGYIELFLYTGYAGVNRCPVTIERSEIIDNAEMAVDFCVTVSLTEGIAEAKFAWATPLGEQAVGNALFAQTEMTAEGKRRFNNYDVELSIEGGEMAIEKIAPRSGYLVSCIIPIYNVGRYLREAIDSVIVQSVGFIANVQLILVNDGSSDDSEEICLEYKGKYPNNIIYISQENVGVSAARNRALDIALGEYICFLDGDDIFDKRHMEEGVKFLKAHEDEVDVVAVPIKFFGNVEATQEHWLNYKFKEIKIVDMNKEYSYIQLNICSTIIKFSAIGNLRFNVVLKYSEDGEFLHNILLNRMKYGILKEPSLLYRKRDDGSSAVQNSISNVGWYHAKIEQFYKAAIEYSISMFGYVTRYTQFLIMYDLQWFKLVKESRFKTAKIPEGIAHLIDVSKMFEDIEYIIQYLDDDIIESAKSLEYWHKFYLLKLKHKTVTLRPDPSGVPHYYVGENKFSSITCNIWINITEEYDNTLHIGGFFYTVSLDNMSFIVVFNDKSMNCVLSEEPHRDTYYLGERIHRCSSFDFYIHCDKPGLLEFYLELPNGNRYPVNLKYAYTSKINDKTGSFFIGENIIVKKTDKRNALQIDSFSYRHLWQTAEEYIKSSFSEPKYKDSIQILEQYIKWYPIMSKKRIWMFMDRFGHGDDSAEYLFKYCANIGDGVEKYFVVDKKSYNTDHLEKVGTVIQYGSGMHKVMYLFAEKYISSHIDNNLLYPFGNDDLNDMFKGFIRSKVVYLNHGIIQGDMSAWYNKLNKNIKLFVTSSIYEYNSILDYPYGYGKDVVKLTGMPRFDTFKDNKQRKILFMPTWRNNLSKGINELNLNFKTSPYCKTISELLSDKRFIGAAIEFGYEILFRPHPEFYVQLPDFEMNDYVEVVPFDTSNKRLYAEGALLITDYSSTALDFAYLKKPVLYYQFGEYHYEKGYFDYDTMGFGEVTTEKDVLIDLIIEHMKNGCIMSDKYKERVDNFFAFTDGNNCKRVYDEIMNLH